MLFYRLALLIVGIVAHASVVVVAAAEQQQQTTRRELRGGRGGGRGGGSSTSGGDGSSGGREGSGSHAGSLGGNRLYGDDTDNNDRNNVRNQQNNNFMWWLLASCGGLMTIFFINAQRRRCKQKKEERSTKTIDNSPTEDDHNDAVKAIPEPNMFLTNAIVVSAVPEPTPPSSFKSHVQQAKAAVMSVNVMVHKQQQQRVEPYCGTYHVNYLDESGNSQTETIDLDFIPTMEGFLIMGSRKLPDGSTTQVEEGFARFDGVAWWKERLTSGTGNRFAMRILSEGTFHFEDGLFYGDWLTSNNNMASGTYTSFMSLSSFMKQEPAMVLGNDNNNMQSQQQHDYQQEDYDAMIECL